MERLKKLIKQNLIGIILGFITIGIMGVSAAGYVASEVSYSSSYKSHLKSTTVKEALDELYSMNKRLYVCLPEDGEFSQSTDMDNFNHVESFRSCSTSIPFALVHFFDPDSLYSYSGPVETSLCVISEGNALCEWKYDDLDTFRRKAVPFFGENNCTESETTDNGKTVIYQCSLANGITCKFSIGFNVWGECYNDDYICEDGTGEPDCDLR